MSFKLNSNISSYLILNLKSFLLNKSSITCLTGAGISTASGIPDYRGINGSYKKGHKPMIHHEFITSNNSRKRYWLRSMAGYKYLSNTNPSKGHYSLTKLQELGIIKNIITQNVDNLHEKAQSKNILHLHGFIHDVKCLNCGNVTSRGDYQKRLEEHNQSYVKFINDSQDITQIRADGDLDLKTVDLTDFHSPTCTSCSDGIIKPDVVFFGDNVPIQVSTLANEYVTNSDGLLIVGTSLEVYSAYRLVRKACNDLKIPVAILNQGITRAEREGLDIQFKSDDDLNELLDQTVQHLVH